MIFDSNSPIGVFDSGLGGLSVLKEMIKLLPNEDFIYYGDTKNAPYGPLGLDRLKELSFAIMDYFVNRGVKAVVVACNTATSAAILDLRNKYSDLIIVGTEPALKPAVIENPSGDIVVMATERTLKERKFSDLMDKVAKDRRVIKMPCPGLVELIEGGKKDSEEVYEFLKNKYQDQDYDINIDDVSAVVLGCTHYPFVINSLEKILPKAKIHHGALGVSKYLLKNLNDRSLLSNKKVGSLEIVTSDKEGEEEFKKKALDLLK